MFSNNKFVFIHIPKTGGTSVKKILNDKLDIAGWSIKNELVKWENPTHKKMNRKLYEKYKNHFKFVFVRHPYDWIKSIYNFKKNRKIFYKKSCNLDINNKIDIDFDTWLDLLNSCNQTDWFINDGILVDKICKLENFSDEMKFILKKLNLNSDFKITHLKNSKKYNIDEIKFLTDKQKIKIQKICKNDFKILNYSI